MKLKEITALETVMFAYTLQASKQGKYSFTDSRKVETFEEISIALFHTSNFY